MIGKIIRIEDAKGRGMYRSYSSAILGLQSHRNGVQLHPAPDEDSLLVANAKASGFCLGDWRSKGDRDKFHYGFKNIEALRRWVYEDEVLRRLHEDGMVLGTYEGFVIHGHTQSIILSETRKVTQRESLLTLL